VPSLPFIWICGASGAGKSVAAWALFEELSADGVRSDHVDIDQLGMLYPAHDDDPERHLLKTEALAALLPGYASAGAQVLVVSGVVDPKVGPGPALADVDLTMCLLSPDPATLRARILARGWDEEEAIDAVTEAAALSHATFLDTVVQTTGLSVAETVNQLRASVTVAETLISTSTPVTASPAEVGVAVVTGPRAAGSSTVGFGLAMGRWRADLRTGFVDLQQLAFLTERDSPGVTSAALGIGQLARMHALMAARGASLLVVSGHLTFADRTAVREALPSASVTIARLRADAPTFEAHVRDRVAGSEARLAGDELVGAAPAHQATVVAAALAEQALLDAGPNDDHVVVDVTGRTLVDVVAEVERIVATRAV
jgi:broad-specificity NMP kinase